MSKETFNKTDTTISRTVVIKNLTGFDIYINNMK